MTFRLTEMADYIGAVDKRSEIILKILVRLYVHRDINQPECSTSTYVSMIDWIIPNVPLSIPPLHTPGLLQVQGET